VGPGFVAFKLAYQVSPILLTGGLAGQIPGGVLPIIAITEAASFFSGLLTGPDNIELDNFWATFRPMPGGTLIDNQIGTYPFANQAVAANAIIAQPLVLSMLMQCPARAGLGMITKLITVTALKLALDQHNQSGGTYTVVTPSYFYTNGILLNMRDVTPGDSVDQPQSHWQLDFAFPLLTLNAAQQLQNNLMAKLTNGSQVDGQPAWSGTSPTVGAPNSLAAPSLIPVTSGLPSANTAPFIGGGGP
jgi:hypothetical protein